MSARLLLVPAPLEQGAITRDWLCADVLPRLRDIELWFVETPKVARAWLKALCTSRPVAQLHIHPVGSGGQDRERARALLMAMRGDDVAGLMSDAGCPGVADPGAELVRIAHEAGIIVEPLVGPSSILLALMASGLQGQRFSFHGYLPIDRQQRLQAIAALAVQSRRDAATQILIETPFRNASMLESLLQALPPHARLCVAIGLGGPAETVHSLRVDQWRAAAIALPKVPAVFCIDCSGARH